MTENEQQEIQCPKNNRHNLSFHYHSDNVSLNQLMTF